MTASDTTLPAPSTRSAASGDQPSWHRWGAIVAVHVACVFLWEAAVRVFGTRTVRWPAPDRGMAAFRYACSDGAPRIAVALPFPSPRRRP